MSNFRIIFIHGYTASHLTDWYPNISADLNSFGIDFAIPDLPGKTRPHANAWLDTIHKEVRKTHKPLVLVGHSLGTRAALLYLEKYKPDTVILTVLVAAFANRVENALRNDGDNYPDFFEHTIDTKQIKKLSNTYVVIHSKDDDDIPFEQGVDIANELNAELIVYKDRGHFSERNNAPLILRELKNKLKF